MSDLIDDYAEDIIDEIDKGNLASDKRKLLEDFLKNANDVQTLLQDKYFENISFDAGVGEISKRVQNATVIGNIIESFQGFPIIGAFGTGFTFNKVGITVKASQYHTSDINGALNKEESTTTNISYTLKDNDPDNFFSIDIINAFDGNGPVFSTVGGRSSCPYEGDDKTHFYTTDFDNSFLLSILAEENRENLSNATQKIESPGISVELASLTVIPETREAEFQPRLNNDTVK